MSTPAVSITKRENRSRPKVHPQSFSVSGEPSRPFQNLHSTPPTRSLRLFPYHAEPDLIQSLSEASMRGAKSDREKQARHRLSQLNRYWTGKAWWTDSKHPKPVPPP